MTKTHAELLGCPFCGGQAVFRPHITPGSVYGPAEYHAEIYCANQECIDYSQEDIVGHWNTRVNKEAGFLEELKAKLFHHRFYQFKTHNEMDDNLDWLINSIEQFQAEQKANDE